MSDVVPHKQALRRQGRLRRFQADPKMITFTPNEGAEVTFADGNAGRATCLGCHDAPCMELEAQPSLDDELGMFPSDPSRDVCPTDAINWDAAGEMPTIEAESCIGCGLCAMNCPYGAISLSPDGIAVVETNDPDGITTPVEEAAAPHVRTVREGALGSATDRFARDLPAVVENLNDTQTTRISRNMLALCGVVANMRRKGDTNIRMDGLLRFDSDQIGVIELETGKEVLESPRALLEDIAVLHNRFGMDMADIVPASMIGKLPNVRAEYYQVIDDIKEVLNIKCRTITLGALCMLMWHFGTLAELQEDLFVTTAGETDLYPSLAQLIPDLPTTEPYPGAYRPPK